MGTVKGKLKLTGDFQSPRALTPAERTPEAAPLVPCNTMQVLQTGNVLTHRSGQSVHSKMTNVDLTASDNLSVVSNHEISWTEKPATEKTITIVWLIIALVMLFAFVGEDFYGRFYPVDLGFRFSKPQADTWDWLC